MHGTQLRLRWVTIGTILGFAALFEMRASGHPGGVDAAGGHVDRKTGIYHFHRLGGPKGVSIDPTTNLPKGSTAPASQKETPRTLKARRENVAAVLLKSALWSKRKEAALNAVADLFPETAAGERARRAAKRLAPSPPTKHLSTEEQAQLEAEQAANARVVLAQQLIALGENDLAVEILEQVVHDEPESNAAKAAEPVLEKMTAEEEVELPDGGFFDAKLKSEE